MRKKKTREKWNRTRYQQGADFERWVRSILEDEGYLVMRSAGSKGPFDLIALRDEWCILIQCTRSGNYANLKKNDVLKRIRPFNLEFPVVVAWRERRNPSEAWKLMTSAIGFWLGEDCDLPAPFDRGVRL